MSKIITITNETKQSFNHSLDDNLIEIEIEYLTIPKRWQMSVTYNDNLIVNGMFLSTDTLQLQGYELPFDIMIKDVDSLGFAPFEKNVFDIGYYEFHILTIEDMESIRGYEVKQ